MSQSKAPTPEPTEIAGRYQVVQKLGAGAFGTVYKARDKVLKRMLAIKTIRLEGLAAAGASLDELLDRFKREAEVSAQLRHPNIVTIYDIGVDAGLSFLAMEFIDGIGLEKLIQQSGKLPLERAASLGAQVADALDFAHKHNVVHRDIKPANVMVEAGDRVKVTDFGIAKVTDSGEHLTMTGSLLGTPSYMSPEQARGGQIDGRSDLFSLGCVIYEMLAGKKAFRGESITALIFKIITEEPPNIRDLDPDLPDEMVRIIARALSKAPETRYPTGRELADDLLAFTRAGSIPTIRQVETPTAPGRELSPTAAPTFKGAAPAASPTLASPLSMTIGSAATSVGPAAPATQVSAPPTRVAPPPAPQRAPTPAVRASEAPPMHRNASELALARAASLHSDASRKAGSGAGLLIGLGLAGLLFVALAAGAGWYLFLRKPAPPTVADAAPAPAETTGASAEPAPASEPPASAPAEAASPSGSASSGTTVPPAPATPTRTAEAPRPAPRAGSAGQSSPGTPGDQASRPARPAAPAGSDLSFLDSEEPLDVGDSRAAAEDLARKYQSDQGSSRGSRFGASGRFARRERNPRPQGPVELSAIKALRYVMDSQEAFHRRSGRYGSLSELFTPQTPLDVAHTADSFQRRGYRFTLELESDGYRLTAMPAQPGPRPFTGDDSGIIRPGLE